MSAQTSIRSPRARIRCPNGKSSRTIHATGNPLILSVSFIPFVAMPSGNWTVVLEAWDIDFAAERTFELSTGSQSTVIVTVTPTVYEGVTMTEDASSRSHGTCEQGRAPC